MQLKNFEGRNYVQISESTISLIETFISCNDLIDSFLNAAEKFTPARGAISKEILRKRLMDFDSHMDSINDTIALMIGDSISYNLTESDYKVI